MKTLNVPRMSRIVVPDDVPQSVEPALNRLGRVADAHRLADTKLRDLLAQRDAAVVSDRQSGAAALLDGRAAPAPTVAKIDERIAAARQQLDVIEGACTTGVAELIGAINGAAANWRCRAARPPCGPR